MGTLTYVICGTVKMRLRCLEFSDGEEDFSVLLSHPLVPQFQKAAPF